MTDIPEYPAFRPLQKEDKAFFEGYLSENPSSASEYTFTNFYIWRLADKTELTLINGNICPLAFAPDKKRYFMMPMGNNKMEDTLKKCLETSQKVIRLGEDFIGKHINGDSPFIVEEDRDNFDYIYLAKDLSELKGRKYDGKRNHLNAFLRSNAFAYEKMDKSHVDECAALNEEWCRTRKRESEEYPNIECEGKVVNEALSNLEYLGLTGGVIKVDGKIKAFSLGERLTPDTAVIHIEKADPALRGMAQLINREFARNAWGSFTYINREQDMGHPGLRKAKLSYHPVRLEKKYSLGLKDKA